MTTAPFALALTGFACFLGAWGALFLKKGAVLLTREKPYNKYLLYGILCDGVGIAIGTTMLRFGELTVLYALNATTYMWITLFSWYFLQEEMTKKKLVGIMCIVLGVALVGISAA